MQTAEKQGKKIRAFTDLVVWQKGHALVLEIYKTTQHFPISESFGLTSQLRRAAVSLTSNIAEGFGRSSQKEKIQFYSVSLGSLTEIQNQLLIARDIGYLKNQPYVVLAINTEEVVKLLYGLMKAIRVSL